VFVLFRRKIGSIDPWASVARSGENRRRPRPRIEIRKAAYEATNGQGGADVTARVTALVASGELSIPASNAVFGDPTPNRVKQLRVEYTLNGKLVQKTAGENETLELAEEPEEAAPAFEVARTRDGALALTPWKPGVYTAQTVRGRTARVQVKQSARRLTLAGPWSLRFPAGWGAPARVRLARLISWSQHPDPGVRYFSGTAEYQQTFTVPAAMLGAGRVLRLDLGRVKNLAEVRLNGRALGVLWKAPFQLDVTGLVKHGPNTLSIRVTNLWANRLIGDAQLPEEVEWRGNAIAAWPQWLVQGKPRPKTNRITFTTWRCYRKGSPLLESGLIGPVSLGSTKRVVVR
jgi:hypothetical protein